MATKVSSSLRRGRPTARNWPGPTKTSASGTRTSTTRSRLKWIMARPEPYCFHSRLAAACGRSELSLLELMPKVYASPRLPIPRSPFICQRPSARKYSPEGLNLAHGKTLPAGLAGRKRQGTTPALNEGDVAVFRPWGVGSHVTLWQNPGWLMISD